MGKENLNNKIDEIYDALSLNIYSIEEDGLMGGKAGAILFIYYYWLHKGKNRNIPVGRFVELLIDLIEKQSNNFSFANGITGMCWLLCFFKNKGLVEINESYFEKVDDLIFTFASSEFDRKNYDLMQGGIGGILYFIERNSLKKIDNLYTRLKEIALINKEGVTWVDGLEKLWFSREKYDFGMAHGVPSVLTTLSMEPSKGHDDIERIKEACKWLFSFENNGEFPHSVSINDNSDSIYQKSGLAWCYGSLGLSTSLIRVGKHINDKNIVERAKQIGLKTCKKITKDESNILDAGLCHGASGAYLLYDKLQTKLELKEFYKSKLHWLNNTIAFGNFEDGLAGYKSFNRITSTWEIDYSLLEGISGIGLVLISASSDLDTDWDRCLLLS